ncbi:hypothetical protein HKCCSP123_16415 [Rhodobacterales bacterium HKCCSP123]|nr:hypothetical protein [Rhodobacterales bacterium HKCCSP123]
MRLPALIALAASALLAACVSTPSEPEQPALTLDSRGIQPTISRLRIDFGRAQVGVVDTVTRLLGEGPVQVSTNAECGAGPVTAAAWADGLTLNFQNGDFVGWVNTDPDLPTGGGIRPGQPRLELPQVSFSITSLGTEFSRSEVYGLLTENDEAVRIVWAGTTCFFR